MIRLALVDDQDLLRASLRALVEGQGDMTVVGEASNGRQALELAGRTAPDIVLMDIRMPIMDGLQATRSIVADPHLGHVKILVLTMFDDDEYVYEAILAGASGFMLKDTSPESFLAAIRAVSAGESLVRERVLRRLIEQNSSGDQLPSPELDRLTRREIEVLTLIGRGLSNSDLMAEMVIGASTVKTHVSHLLTKLGARDRAQLVIAAYEFGLVEVGNR